MSEMNSEDTSRHNAEKKKIFDEIVRARRSVRFFKNEKIEDTVIIKALEHAILAPNSSNLQPTEFYWVKGEKKRAILASICLGQSGATTASELIVCVARTKTWKEVRDHQIQALKKFETEGLTIPKGAFNYYEKLVPLVYGNGFLNLKGFLKRILLFVLGLKKPMVRGPVNENDLKLWAVKSSALACENFILSVQAAGYDSLAMEGFDAVRMNSFLNLPSDAVTVMVIAVGVEQHGKPVLPRVRMDQSHSVKIIND